MPERKRFFFKLRPSLSQVIDAFMTLIVISIITTMFLIITIGVIGLGQIVVTSNGDRTGPQRPRKLQNTKSHKHEIPKT